MTHQGRKRLILLAWLLLSSCVTSLVAVAAAASAGTTTLPRSTALPRSSRSSSNHGSTLNRRHPPWNTSPQIDSAGFLKGTYVRIPGDWEQDFKLRTFPVDTPCQIRQTPGDGNCLFHSISLCLQYAVNHTHWNMHDCLDQLYEHSSRLRASAVDCLRQRSRKLVLQGREQLRSHELVQAAASQYDLTPQEYCDAMEQDCVWGGGPEIVALSNILQRPIHVYELSTDNGGCFVLRRMACFGSPRFDKRDALHILSADSRFPDVTPGAQMLAGNHFLAVFPCRPKKKRLRATRGGGTAMMPSRIMARFWTPPWNRVTGWFQHVRAEDDVHKGKKQ